MSSQLRNVTVVTLALCGTAFAEPPTVKVLTAELKSPSTTSGADSWYPASLTSTRKLCSLVPTHVICTGGRPAHIKELARTLGSGRVTQDAFTSRVFEYVYANIDTEFRYGLSKGALGAVLDQSGTPFDQAMLMVELLREGGVTAGYRAGTIQLDGTQFSAWTGITNATAACRLLADGGIPADVNPPSSSATCSYGTASVSTVVMSHIWVTANGKLYDPTYKKYTFKSAIDLGTITTCGGSTTCATTVRNKAIPSGLQYQGTETLAAGRTAEYVQKVQVNGPNGLNEQLRVFGQNIEDHIKPNLTRVAWEVEDLAGGRSVDLATIPQPPVGSAADLRAPILPQQQRVWDGDIPDAYRTKLRVQAGTAAEIDQTLYADEITGYWLTVAGGGVSISNATTTRGMELQLWGPNFASGPAVVQTTITPNVSWTTARLILSVDHPYYAASTSGGTLGTYMDQPSATNDPLMLSYTAGYLFLPTVIANSWGRVGTGHLSYFSKGASEIFVNMNSAVHNCEGTTIWCDRIQDGGYAAYVTLWMAEAAEAMKLADSINQTRTEHHHTFGVVANNQGMAFVNARSSVSVLSATNSTSDRRAGVATQVALLSMLEGSAGEQQNDAWGTSSSIGLFSLANEKALAPGAPAKAHRFYNATPNNIAQLWAVTTGYTTADRSFIQSYVSSSGGYSAIVSHDGTIGNFNWGNYVTQFPMAPLFAWQSDDTRLAYISTGRNKGAGYGSATADAVAASMQLADPKQKRDIKIKVDLAGGGLTYTAPPDIVTGQGDFPVSLPFQRSINSFTRDRFEAYWLPDPLYPFYHPIEDPKHPIRGGWRHNYEVFASIGNDAFQALGQDSALDASATVSALYVMRALNVNSQTFKDRVTSIFVMDWLAKQMVDNVVVVSRPPAGGTFQRLPSGVYNPPPASSEILERTGARTRAMAGMLNYDYRNITLALTDRDGSVVNFSTGDYEASSGYANGGVFLNKFKADSWVFPDGIRLDFTYSAPTQLPSGNGQVLHMRTYLTKVANNLGRSLTFTNDTSGNMVVKDESNRQATFDIWGGWATDSSGMTMTYNVEGGYAIMAKPLESITMPSGNKIITVQYDALGRVKYLEDAQQNRTNYFPAKVSAERFARGESMDPLGAITAQYVNELNLPVQSVDPIGRYAWNKYDGTGRIIRRTAPEGNSIEYTYDVRSNLRTITKRPKSGSGTQVSTNNYFTGETTWRCPAAEVKRCNKKTSVDGPRTDVTDVSNFTYSQSTGQLLTETGAAVTGGNPLATNGYLPYTANNTPSGTATTVSMLDTITEKIDATRSTTTKLGYDTLAEHLALKTVTVDSTGAALSVQFAYDAAGNVQSMTDPRGKVTISCFDDGRRLRRLTKQIGTLDVPCSTTTVDPTGDDLVAMQDYDGDGNLQRTRFKDSDFGVWRDVSYVYTPSWQLETEIDASGNVTRYDYDAAGRTAMVTDPAGRKQRTFFNADGTVRKEIRGYQFGATSSDESCSIPGTDQQCYVQLTYAPIGGNAANYNSHLHTITDANGNITTNTFDSFDRPDRSTYPDGTFEQVVSYDSANNVLEKRNRAGEIIVKDYDALNREWHKTNSTIPAVLYEYDLLSRTIGVTQTGGQALTWFYDTVGRLKYTRAGGRQVDYEYDDSGNRRQLKWPDGFFIEYKYDDANRLWQVWENDINKLAEYTYNSLSQRSGLWRGNGDTTTYKYEPDGDLWYLEHTGLPTVPKFTLGRNPAHQITSYQLSDSALFWTPSSGSTSYTPNNLNQYALVGTTNYGYDQKGNLTGDGVATYTYDAENVLRTATLAGTQTNYTYDGMGRRISKKVGPAAATDFLSDGDEEIAEYSGTTLLRRYVYGPGVDDRILMYEGAGTAAADKRYYYSNHLGSTVQTADGSGNVIDSFKYSPFGESTTVTGNPFRYTGRRYDPETGLYFYRARYYSPSLGRFLQTDPIGAVDDYNLYSYAKGDPVNNTDPSGKVVPLVIAAGAACIESGLCATAAIWAGRAVLAWWVADQAGQKYQEKKQNEAMAMTPANIGDQSTTMGPGNEDPEDEEQQCLIASYNDLINGVVSLPGGAGVYSFDMWDDALGFVRYNGQSSDLLYRLGNHVNAGKLDSNRVVTIVIMDGSTQAEREVAEQGNILEESGGVRAKDSDRVGNRRDNFNRNNPARRAEYNRGASRIGNWGRIRKGGGC